MTFTTRIAPSPTGDMHLGTARTAYFNWLAAKASGGKFLLRIDDTDTERNKEEHVDVVLRTMEWLKLDYDMYVRQSANLKRGRYQYVADRLVAAGLAKHVEDGAILLTWRPSSFDRWKDVVAGDVRVSPTDYEHMETIVLMRRNGGCTYNFATVVDDRDYCVNYIIRGTDHIPNTAKQLVIWQALDIVEGNIPFPQFAHIGLITKDGKKMSKRDGAASMLHYENEKYDPEAVLNFMLRLGWGPKQDDKTTALLPRDRAISLFLTGGRMRNAPSAFDQAKLDSFQRKYAGTREKAHV